jgi:hypothetical protein
VRAWLPVSEKTHKVLRIINDFFHIFSMAFLYWDIILFLGNYENTLYTETNGHIGERKFYQSIVHALLCSLLVVLAGTPVGLKVILEDGAVTVRPISSPFEMKTLSFNFNISVLCLLVMVVDVFVSTRSLRRSMQNARVNTKV